MGSYLTTSKYMLHVSTASSVIWDDFARCMLACPPEGIGDDLGIDEGRKGGSSHDTTSVNGQWSMVNYSYLPLPGREHIYLARKRFITVLEQVANISHEIIGLNHGKGSLGRRDQIKMCT